MPEVVREGNGDERTLLAKAVGKQAREVRRNPWCRRVPGRPGEHERSHARGGADGELGRDLRAERVRDQHRLWPHEPLERVGHLLQGDPLEIDGAGSRQQRLQVGEVAVAETETVHEHGHPASR